MATTAVELQPIPQNTSLAPTASARREDPTSSSTEDILEASRAADAEVPDGGYGWVVITGCAVLTWHVSVADKTDADSVLLLIESDAVCWHKL